MDCPNCGMIMEIDQEVCNMCGFDFNDTLQCPYRISNRCIFSQLECKKIGLQYENCQTYLTKSGIVVK